MKIARIQAEEQPRKVKKYVKSNEQLETILSTYQNNPIHSFSMQEGIANNNEFYTPFVRFNYLIR